MLKRQCMLFCAIGCIIWAGSLFAAGAAMTGTPVAHLTPASSVQAQPVNVFTTGGYLFQLASGSTNASPGKSSPSPNCPGGVNPDIPKPHEGGGGKKKAPTPIIVPCAPNGGVTHG